ncbi:type II toxin-antitoxin system RelE/ParE family toxin [Flagellimonas sp. HMM57]|uniref:type II toxin-antitoxin system RelE/ParE family toxin n=1 Tax=unclassified Flagellimonas TaxID=2644544 RepID=UPI0013D1AA4B|nr:MULTISPECIES: type II toxin-antitoxin system RelE/ParE family toxin [unclassified Flagellimonas]UII76976.1 type II toxin-antitoxin system RelE/ParE family toxin [Flagellimonas sp. HMM57]
MVQVNWTPQAISDLKDIADYIKKDSKYYAKLQVIRIKSRVEILKRQIYLGSLVPEFERDDIRQLIEGNYRIIYKVVSKDRVDILTVNHSARDLTRRNIK